MPIVLLERHKYCWSPQQPSALCTTAGQRVFPERFTQFLVLLLSVCPAPFPLSDSVYKRLIVIQQETSFLVVLQALESASQHQRGEGFYRRNLLAPERKEGQ